MSGLVPNTGNKTMDAAYIKLQEHVNICKSFDEFQQHFNYVSKTEDKELLNKWLLKVLFVSMKQSNQAEKHDFDKLLENASEADSQKLKTWLQNELEKVGGNN